MAKYATAISAKHFCGRRKLFQKMVWNQITGGCWVSDSAACPRSPDPEKNPAGPARCFACAQIKFLSVEYPTDSSAKLMARYLLGAEYGVEILLLLKSPTVARLGVLCPLTFWDIVSVQPSRMQTARR
jgi:hypothetical protein